VRQEFIKYIEREKRYSRHTVKSYQTDLKQFQEYLIQQFDITNYSVVTHPIIRSWLVWLLEQGNTSKTINRKISTLKSFYKYLQKRGVISKSPMLKIISPKIGKKTPEFVKETDLDKLLNEIDFGSTFDGIQSKLIIETFYMTGIRVSELTTLKLTHIDFNRQVIKIIGKRNKERMVPLPKYLKSSIQSFLVIRSELLSKLNIESTYLFITKRGKQTYSELVYRVIHKYLNYVSTNSKKSPHTLRHSFATIMLNEGADLNSIKEILGHSNLSATQVYTHNSIEKLKTIYKQAHPRA